MRVGDRKEPDPEGSHRHCGAGSNAVLFMVPKLIALHEQAVGNRGDAILVIILRDLILRQQGKQEVTK